MNIWDEKRVRRQIDDVILESYLLCLGEREVRSYLKHFLDSCEAVLDGGPEGGNPRVFSRSREAAAGSGRGNLKIAGIRVAMLKAYLLLSADPLAVKSPRKNHPDPGTGESDEFHYFVERVVAAKGHISRLLEEFDPTLSKAVREDCRRRGESGKPLPKMFNRAHIIVFVVVAAVVFIAAMVLFLLKIV